MSSAAFASFVTLPVVITQPGQYRTRCGEVVSVERSSSKHNFGCQGRYSSGQTENWHRSGRLYFGQHCQNDIVQAV